MQPTRLSRIDAPPTRWSSALEILRRRLDRLQADRELLRAARAEAAGADDPIYGPLTAEAAEVAFPPRAAEKTLARDRSGR
ncbi:MAG: hypothetical protein KDE27_18160 [Planctomycetes bacterium]|nr:hypothetical protein [Planctomycetota bacterium]